MEIAAATPIGTVTAVTSGPWRPIAIERWSTARLREVRPLELPLQRQQREHEVPLDAGTVHERQRVLVAGVAAARPVVEQDPHRHTAGLRTEGEHGAGLRGFLSVARDPEAELSGALEVVTGVVEPTGEDHAAVHRQQGLVRDRPRGGGEDLAAVLPRRGA
ncbi:hypothetical protein IAE22_27700 [Bacillus sp. S34]|nr:hypothetical protein [Bacillus sp. S34]